MFLQPQNHMYHMSKDQELIIATVSATVWALSFLPGKP